jgi:hypothetical protein
MMPLLLRSGSSFLLETLGRIDHRLRFEGANMDLAFIGTPPWSEFEGCRK